MYLPVEEGNIVDKSVNIEAVLIVLNKVTSLRPMLGQDLRTTSIVSDVWRISTREIVTVGVSQEHRGSSALNNFFYNFNDHNLGINTPQGYHFTVLSCQKFILKYKRFHSIMLCL